MIKKLKIIIIALGFCIPMLSVGSVFAAPCEVDGSCPVANQLQEANAAANSLGGNTLNVPVGDFCVTTSGLSNEQNTACQKCDSTGNQVKGCLQSNSIVKDLQVIVNTLSALVGVVIVGALVMGGIQYSTASDSPGGTAAAKKRITDAVIALILFMFMFAFLQWLIPGGIFG